jgi:hypothetical protein
MNFYKHNNLVYLCIPKHASTTYRGIFHDHLGWKKVDIHDINWETDKVFAHIINPDVRHTKGTVEFLIELNLDQYIDHPLLKTLLTCAIFDHHSQPIVGFIGKDLCYKIHWIPLDHVDSDRMTNIFLRDHGIEIDVSAFPKEGVRSIEKHRLYKTIERLKEQVKTNSANTQFTSVRNWFDRDFILYDDVVCNIRPERETWNEISWIPRFKPFVYNK